MRDFLEHLEASAEAHAEALNLRGDEIDCPGCGKRCKLNDMHPVSANPYSMPCCGECLEKMYPELGT